MGLTGSDKERCSSDRPLEVQSNYCTNSLWSPVKLDKYYPAFFQIVFLQPGSKCFEALYPYATLALGTTVSKDLSVLRSIQHPWTSRCVFTLPHFPSSGIYTSDPLCYTSTCLTSWPSIIWLIVSIEGAWKIWYKESILTIVFLLQIFS